jgi:hypothetical protein
LALVPKKQGNKPSRAFSTEFFMKTLVFPMEQSALFGEKLKEKQLN